MRGTPERAQATRNTLRLPLTDVLLKYNKLGVTWAGTLIAFLRAVFGFALFRNALYPTS